MATYLDLITRSMRLAGIIGEEESPTAAQAANALATVNDMIAGLNTQSNALYQSSNDSAVLVPGQATYTVGPGGNFSIDRPSRITAAYVDYQGVSYPLLEATQEEYNNITLKTQTQILPRFYLYLNSNPLGTLTLWPVPSEAITLYMSADLVLPPATLSAVVVMPPGYEKAWRLELACDLCLEYGKEPSPTLQKMARDASADVKRNNWTSSPASFDPELVGRPGGIAGFLSGY